MAYKIPIPPSRGYQDTTFFAQAAQQTVSAEYVRDLILHALIFRASYKNDSNLEFRTYFQNNMLELDIAQEKLDQIISTVDFGPILEDFKRWLFGAPSSSIDVTSDFATTKLTSNRTILLCDVTSGNITIDLTELKDGYELIIKKLDDSINSINFSDTIDGDSDFKILKQYESITLLKKNNAYHII